MQTRVSTSSVPCDSHSETRLPVQLILLASVIQDYANRLPTEPAQPEIIAETEKYLQAESERQRPADFDYPSAWDRP